MKILVTGSAGHLGEALMRTLPQAGHAAVGLDLASSELTDIVGSITDRAVVRRGMEGVDAVLHTATLHKPHVGTHSRGEFVDTNITGTLNLLEEAVSAGVGLFVLTSTTSAFGAALTPPVGGPAAWVTEEVAALPKNIYGVTKVAAETLCELFARRQRLACVVLRVARFFPEPDDDPATRHAYADSNVKANEFLFRRVELADVVQAHLCALDKAPSLGFGRYIISATTPFMRHDLNELRVDAPTVVRRRVPQVEADYARLGWMMFPSIDRVYVNQRARDELDWRPRYDFAHILDRLRAGEDLRSPLARLVGSKGYHAQQYTDGLYPLAAE